MKLLQILSASACSLMALSAPYAATAAIGPEIGLSQASFGNADLILPTDGTFEVSRRGRGRDDAPGDDRGRGRGKDDARVGTSVDFGIFQLARGGSDDSHDDRGRGDNDRSDDRGRGDHDSNGHHSSGHHISGDDASGSGRNRARVPGGSGCDSAGDIAEHAGCS